MRTPSAPGGKKQPGRVRSPGSPGRRIERRYCGALRTAPSLHPTFILAPPVQYCRRLVWAAMARPLRLLLLLALILRIAAAVTTLVINHDGARFTMSARAMAAGDWDAALNVEPRMPPLYPMLIHGVSTVTGSLGRAGALISVLCGTLLVIPLYLLARAMFGDRIAWLSGLVV